jgi:alkanesulfonate monooxygenase SsuD/methylene tetrahydromethanopterin reductase-like flavin-dependent oxidoreductase (luciferase family)
MAGSIRQLLDGQTVPAADLGVLRDVRLEEPLPVQQPLPLLVGGGNRELLRWAGGHADAVGLSGLGRTLADGHRHTARWSPHQVDEQVGLVQQGARDAGVRVPDLEALVQQVVITDDRGKAAAALAEDVKTPTEDVLAAPYAWIGTVPEIVQQLHTARQTWGITRWVIRPSALEHAAEIIAAAELDRVR